MYQVAGTVLTPDRSPTDCPCRTNIPSGFGSAAIRYRIASLRPNFEQHIPRTTLRNSYFTSYVLVRMPSLPLLDSEQARFGDRERQRDTGKTWSDKISHDVESSVRRRTQTACGGEMRKMVRRSVKTRMKSFEAISRSSREVWFSFSEETTIRRKDAIDSLANTRAHKPPLTTTMTFCAKLAV